MVDPEVVAGNLVGVIAGGNQTAAVGNRYGEVGAACRYDHGAALIGLVAAGDNIAVVAFCHILAEADHCVVEVVDCRNFFFFEVGAALLTGLDLFLIGERRSGEVKGLRFCLCADDGISTVNLVLVDVLCPAAFSRWRIVGEGVVALCPIDDLFGRDASVDPVAAVGNVNVAVADSAHDGAAVHAVGDADIVGIFVHDTISIAAGVVKDLTVAVNAGLCDFFPEAIALGRETDVLGSVKTEAVHTDRLEALEVIEDDLLHIAVVGVEVSHTDLAVGDLIAVVPVAYIKLIVPVLTVFEVVLDVGMVAGEVVGNDWHGRR